MLRAMPTEADILAPLPEIEAFLDRAVTSPRADRPPALLDAMRYAALGGGKRLRPLLSWWCAVASGGTGRESLPVGCAVELVHAFSLVHDDLPALDNDDLRRGQPTLHKHAGEAMAILTGDQLLVEAFDLLLHEPSLPPTTRAALCAELSRASSSMVYGQVYDVAGGLPPGGTPEDHLHLVHRNKTGALIRASCRMGAICAGAADDSPTLDAITAFGDAAGVLFQAVDDLLDVTQSHEHTGKRTNKDARAGKLTYPGVMGVERTKSEIERLRLSAISAANPLGARGAALVDITNLLAARTR